MRRQRGHYKWNLSVSDLTKAIKEIEEYIGDIEVKEKEFFERVIARGVEIAIEEVNRLVYVEGEDEPTNYRTGALRSSIGGTYDLEQSKGWIYAGGNAFPYAAFVEFGTGPKGSASPHPDAGEQDWDYCDYSWWYFNPNLGKLIQTWGYHARPFMYNTKVRLEKEIPKITKEVFSS